MGGGSGGFFLIVVPARSWRWLWMLPVAYARLSADVFASAAIATNIALWLHSGYFDIESAKKPLLHLWSLGIEEQFYLIWPLILMLAAVAAKPSHGRVGDRTGVICPQRRADRYQPGRDLLAALQPSLRATHECRAGAEGAEFISAAMPMAA